MSALSQLFKNIPKTKSTLKLIAGAEAKEAYKRVYKGAFEQTLSLYRNVHSASPQEIIADAHKVAKEIADKGPK